MFKPKLFSLLKDYSFSKFNADLLAGVIVGIVALPLAIAFAVASGVRPEQGLYTAVVAGFIISVFGGSNVQIGGPTGAFVVIVYGVIQKFGYDGLAIACIMAGIIVMLMGLFKLGSAIKFIPHPLVVGFTSGIAVIIFSSQVKDLFGLNIEKVPADFMEKWTVYFSQSFSFNIYAVCISLFSIALIALWPKVSRKIPGSLIALIIATLAVHYLNLPVETIGKRFGAIPSGFIMPSLPEINFSKIKMLFQPAFTIAVLAAIESLLSAVVADGMTGDKHRSNMELIAQGLANIASPLFGGIPATGAIARTATNIKNGAKTPVAGIVHALILLLIMFSFGNFAALIPMPALAAILAVVSYNMSEWRSFKVLLKAPRSDILVLVSTFLLTVLVDLTVAIEAGILLSFLLFIRRVSQVTDIEVFSNELKEDKNIEEKDDMALSGKIIPKGVQVFEINGPFFFGSASKFKEAVSIIDSKPKVRILRLRKVSSMDATAIHVIQEFYKDCKKNGVELILSGINKQPFLALEKAGFLEVIGRENICNNIDLALAYVKKRFIDNI